MKKKLIKSYTIATLVIIIIAGFIYLTRSGYIDTHKKITLNQNDVTLVKTLKTPDGTILGNVNVTYITKDVFTALYIVKEIDGKNIVLYKINSDGFFNTLGKEEAVSKNNFYGYQFALIKDNYFVLHLLGNGGKDISDDATIVWNSDKMVFEIQRPN